MASKMDRRPALTVVDQLVLHALLPVPMAFKMARKQELIVADLLVHLAQLLVKLLWEPIILKPAGIAGLMAVMMPLGIQDPGLLKVAIPFL
jgi:hypothetical protein